MNDQYSFQIASDIIRDGLGAELMDQEGTVIAEVFRSDVKKTVVLNTFNNDIPLGAIMQLIEFARDRLDPFEDGTPLARFASEF